MCCCLFPDDSTNTSTIVMVVLILFVLAVAVLGIGYCLYTKSRWVNAQNVKLSTNVFIQQIVIIVRKYRIVIHSENLGKKNRMGMQKKKKVSNMYNFKKGEIKCKLNFTFKKSVKKSNSIFIKKHKYTICHLFSSFSKWNYFSFFYAQIKS